VDKGVDNALWITPVDKVEVVPRLWIRLWITFESTLSEFEGEDGSK
jgi:hypothetical protein